MATYFDTRPEIVEFDITITNENLLTGTVAYNIPNQRVAFAKLKTLQTRKTGGPNRNVAVVLGTNESVATFLPGPFFPNEIVNITNSLNYYRYACDTAGFSTKLNNDPDNFRVDRGVLTPWTVTDSVTYSGELLELVNKTQLKVFTIGDQNIPTGFEVKLFFRVYLFGG